MNMVNFSLVIGISLFVGIFIGFCLKKIVTSMSRYYLRCLKQPRYFIEISSYLKTSCNKQDANDKTKKTT